MLGARDQRSGESDETLQPQHIPVLLGECLRCLAPQRGGLFVDCTVGLGGHAEAILDASESTELVGFDRDPEALAQSRQRLARFGDRVSFVEDDFRRLASCLVGRLGEVAGILADLGVSSMQLDRPERGFSFRFDGPLDMRMARGGADNGREDEGRGDLTAADVVNHYSEEDLERILRDYGEERQARRIARAIVSTRAETPFQTTAELRDLVHRVQRFTPGSFRRSPARGSSRRTSVRRLDPATRVFQALRIEVNDEIAGLDTFVDSALDVLAPGGRLAVIAYHSLEDRQIKHAMRRLGTGEIDPVTGQTIAGTQRAELLSRKPIRPSDEEIERNPRSRSAKLRALETLDVAPRDSAEPAS